MPGGTLRGDRGLGADLVEARAAVDGPVVPGLERHHGLAAATVAHRRVGLARSPGAHVSGLLRCRAARRAPLRVVGEALAGEEGLLTGREHERLTAIAAGQRPILEHPSISSVWRDTSCGPASEPAPASQEDRRAERRAEARNSLAHNTRVVNPSRRRVFRPATRLPTLDSWN